VAAGRLRRHIRFQPRSDTMLIQILIHQPQALGAILKNTPVWVWGLLAGLMVLGLSQLRSRNASQARVTLLPVTMTALSIWGTVSAFGASPLFGTVMLVWLATAAVVLAGVASTAAPRGATYDAASRTYRIPGSWIPLALIAAIFLVKYVVGVDLAMQPVLARDSHYTLIVAALYGTFSGIFIGRAARLWRLAFRPASANAAAFNA
jgi:hypothetical protein